MKMKLAMIVERYRPSGGGAERSSLQIARELSSRGHHVTILAGSASKEDCEKSDLPVLAMGRGKISSARRLVRFAGWVKKQLKQGQFDASLSMTLAAPATVVEPRSGVYRESSARAVARRRTPAAQAMRRFFQLLTLKYHATLFVERAAVRDASVKKFVAISRYMARQLTEHYGIAPDRIELIHNAAELPVMSEDQRTEIHQRVREGFHIPDGQIVFLFAAMDPWRKGFEPLMHAFARALQLCDSKKMTDGGAAISKPYLLIVGESEYRQQHMAANLGVRENVRFMGQTQRIVDLYAAADVTVLPTYYDPASKVLIESMMMGTPVIGSAFDGSSDLVNAQSATPRGLVVQNPADIEELAQAILKMCEPVQLQKYRSATQGIREELTMSRHVDRLEKVLKDAIAASR